MFGRWRKMFHARPRTWVAFGVTVGAGALLSPFVAWPTSTTLGWDLGVVVYLAAVLRLALTETSEAIRVRAERDDDGAVLILIITCLASVITLGAIGYEFATTDSSAPLDTILRVALAAVTIVLSWFMVHTSFAIHYAHEHYGQDEGEARGGLKFPTPDGKETYDPDYWDFFYFSANLGAAAQTSDVQIVSRKLRRIVLAHTVVAFLFNTLILALGVNLAASVIKG